MDLDSQFSALLDLAFEEDGVKDITSEALFDVTEEKEATVMAKQSGVICGLKFSDTIARKVDESLVLESFLEEGDSVRDRMLVMGLSGKVISLLRVERILLNFLSRLSGIATLTKEFVKAIEGTQAVILDTRKTIPGWRFLDKYAVTVGGGINHRKSLEDVAMIKDTHVDACGGVENAIRKFREKEMTKPLIVEVRSLEELRAALPFAKSLTRIMLDNFSVELMKEAVGIASGKILLEASGNITLENARSIAETGVHFLSIGALTHSAPGFDLSFKIAS